MTIHQIIAGFERRLRRRYKSLQGNYPEIYRFTQSREMRVAAFFVLLITIILMKSFDLQVLNYSNYDRILSQNHSLKGTMEANRGNVFINDSSQYQPIQLTQNVTLFNIFVDPEFVKDKSRFIELITPLVQSHLCETNGFQQVDQEQCVKNLENFTRESYLPSSPYIMYLGQDVMTGEVDFDAFDWTGYNASYENILSGFTQETITTTIAERLDNLITIGERKYNYLGYYVDSAFIQSLKALDSSAVYIHQNSYVFIEPRAIRDVFAQNKTIRDIESVLITHGHVQDAVRVSALFRPRSYRYVKLISGVNPRIVEQLNNLKREYFTDRDEATRTPLLHGLGTESYITRYYPYGNFMSHLLGYMNNNGQATYGVEEYFDPLLRGRDGKIEGRASAMIGQLGANDVLIENVENGLDVYLTIDPVIQKQVENIIRRYREVFVADSVSILVYDPYSGHVLAAANAPDFDPNNYNDIYRLQPLSPDQAQLVDNLTYLDFPVYVKTGGETRLATIAERSDITLEKYVANNPLGPNLFVDKNISYPYEPGSIFKPFTYAVGLDQNEIAMYDWYEDRESEIKVGPFTIRNASVEVCRGRHTFLHALMHSCNVGMVRIAQRLTMNTFYNYMDKLGFGKLTNIELAGEQAGFVERAGTVSVARFFNNVFGQGLLVTPIQIAAGYGAMLNGGTYIKPTILSKICEAGTDNCQHNDVQVVRQVFESRITDLVKDSLVKVLEVPDNQKHASLSNYTVGGKSGTSQISYRGRYRGGNGWTNGSFVGMVTRDNTQYIVVVQVRRPRSTQRGSQTAGVIFRDTAGFLINYATLRGEKFEIK